MFHQPNNSVGNYSYNGLLYQRVMWKMHFHRNYELICVVCGTVWVRTAHFEKTLIEGELLIVPPNEPHCFTVSDDSSKIWVGVFSEDHIKTFAGKTHGSYFSSFFCDEEVWSFLKNRLILKKELALYERIACFYLVCAECEKHAKKLSQNEDSDLMFQILSYMEQHFQDNLTLSEMAESLGYEYHYFSTLFHACFSMNFREFLNTYRFEYACELMEKQEKSLTEIAMESGFGSIRSFNRIFLAQSGMRPKDYLAKKRQIQGI